MARSLIVTAGRASSAVCLPLGDGHPHDRLVVLDALTYMGNRESRAAGAGRTHPFCRGRYLQCQPGDTGDG